MNQVTFAEVQRVVESLGSPMTAAEGHGYMCGSLCTSVQCSFDRWLEEIIPAESRPVDEEQQAPLRLLANGTAVALQGAEMLFEPLLPEDDVALSRRAAALCEWCQGFLYGFSTGALDPAKWPENVGEILRDITQISRLDTAVDDASEEDEQSYTEVVEYVRVGVQLIHDELFGLRQAQGEFH